MKTVYSFLAAGAILALSTYAAHAQTFTVTLSDGTPADTVTYTDGGNDGGYMDFNLAPPALSFDGWKFTELTAVFDSVDGPPTFLDLAYHVSQWNINTPITITLTAAGVPALGSDGGSSELTITGSDPTVSPTSQVTLTGLINNSAVGSVGPLGGANYTADQSFASAGLSSDFTLSESLVLSGSGQTGGAAEDFVTANDIPEPSTMTLLLLPAGGIALWILRRRKTA